MHAKTLYILAAIVATLASSTAALGQVIYGNKGAVIYDPRYGSDQGKSKMNINQRRGFSKLRDDILWHAESANVVYQGAGNVSLLSATRYGMTDRLELSTYLVEDVIRPTVYAKVLWGVFDRKKWFVSSRFDIANAYPGLSLAQSLEVDRIIKQDVDIPLVFEVGHEILLSRAWYTDPNCSDNSVYLILTGGLGLYGGINCMKADTLEQPRFHFLANRSETLIDNGFRARFKFWVDGRLTNRIYAHGGIYYHTGFFSKHHAVELQGEAEFFFSNRISAKLGFLTSFAHYRGIDKHAAIWPIVDVTYYFGKRNKSEQTSLFDRKAKKRSGKSKHLGELLNQ